MLDKFPQIEHINSRANLKTSRSLLCVAQLAMSSHFSSSPSQRQFYKAREKSPPDKPTPTKKNPVSHFLRSYFWPAQLDYILRRRKKEIATIYRSVYHFFLLSTAFAIPVRSRVAEQKEKENVKKARLASCFSYKRNSRTKRQEQSVGEF